MPQIGIPTRSQYSFTIEKLKFPYVFAKLFRVISLFLSQQQSTTAGKIVQLTLLYSGERGEKNNAKPPERVVSDGLCEADEFLFKLRNSRKFRHIASRSNFVVSRVPFANQFSYQFQWQSTRKPSVKYSIYRWILASYFNFVLVLSIITAEGCKQLDFYAIYLTNWNVMLNAFSTLFGALLVSFYYKNRTKLEEHGMTKTLKFYWLLATLSTVISITLSCVYWPLIYTGRDKGVNDSLTHAGNAIVFLADIFINAHPPRYGHFVYPLAFGVVYAFLFSLPYTLLGGTDRDYNNFIYSVLDWKNNTKAALTFAAATIVFLTFMHFFLTFLASTRVYLHRKLQSRKPAVQSSATGNSREFDNPSFSP